MAEAESYSPLSLRERINLLKRKPTLSNIDIDDDKVPDWSEYNSNKSTSSTNKSKLKGSGIGGIADKNSLDKNSKIRRTDSGVKTDESVKLVLDHLSDNGVNESRPPLENMCDQDNDSDDTDDNVTLSSCVQSKLDKSSGNIDSCYTRIKGSHQVLNREMTSSCFPAENIDVDDNELPVVLSNYYRNRSQSNVLHLSDESISTHNIRMFNEDITYENRFKEQNTGTAIERQKCPTETKDDKTMKKLNKEQEIRERKVAREKERLEKKATKEQEKLRKKEEREMKKELQEREKAAKKAERLTVRTDSRDQCLKHMITVLDPVLVNDGGGSILQALEGLGAQYEVKSLPVASSVGWMREKIQYNVGSGVQINRQSEYVEETHMLLRLKAEEFARMVRAQKQNGQFSMHSSSEGILEYVDHAETLLPQKKLSLAIMGMDAYSKKAKAKQKSHTSKKSNHQDMPVISRVEMEEILLALQLRSNCVVHFCETSEDLAQMIAMTTKAVAEAPYKKDNSLGLNVFVQNGEKGLARVTKDGIGLLEVWTKQIQQFKNVGYDMAASIVREYQSPYLLFQAYKNCPSEKSAELLLQDIEVRRGHGVLATVRRIGPELSKKVYRLLTLRNPAEELTR